MTAEAEHEAGASPVSGTGPQVARIDLDTDPKPADVLAGLSRLHGQMCAAESAAVAVIDSVHPTHRSSAANLVHYLSLRGQDVRSLQRELADLGLSSLGRCEGHVLPTVEQVLSVLARLAGADIDLEMKPPSAFSVGPEILRQHAQDLLGPVPAGRPTRIMVTMPTEAADDVDVVAGFVARGMDCARINCAHDDPDAWVRMANNIRTAAAQAGRPCPIVMDLPGPKLRTGPIQAGPQVLKVRPRRDELGRLVDPATVWLTPPGTAGPQGSVKVPVNNEAMATLQAGDHIELHDSRGAHRRWTVATVEAGAVSVLVPDTTYVTPRTVLRGPGKARSSIGTLPAVERALRLRRGDTLTLTSDPTPAVAPGPGLGDGPTHATISCTLPEALVPLRTGQRIWFDDGRIGGTVASIRPGEADITITVAAPNGSKLRAGKGINLPDTNLHLPALGPEDRAALPFVIELADVVGMSFVQRPADIITLRRTLGELGGSHLGILLKIETAKGFNRLPQLLLAAMQNERTGVMIARGDLAVECGFERLAEVQEEILWLTEAARLPVVWATQVLDQLARTGQPSRAEITDAAMSERAECVMLNKGPHLPEAITALDSITHRMSSHQDKKGPLLRRLKAWTPEPQLG